MQNEKCRMQKANAVKLTAQRKGDPLTTSLTSSFDRARWYRQRMRAAALAFRRWRRYSGISWARSELQHAITLRNRALFHENLNRS